MHHAALMSPFPEILSCNQLESRLYYKAFLPKEDGASIK